MSFVLQFDGNSAHGRLQRLDYRYRRAQNALACARSIYGSLREMPGASAHRLHQALLQVQQAQRYLFDLQSEIEMAEDRGAIA